MIEELLPSAFKYGGPFAVLAFALIFYMRKDHRKDYEGVTKRLNDVEDYQRNRLTDSLDANTRVIAENTQTLAEVKQVIHQCKHRG